MRPQQFARIAEHESRPRARSVIGQRRAAAHRVGRLLAVQRGAVQHRAQLVLGIGPHGVDPEIAAGAQPRARIDQRIVPALRQHDCSQERYRRPAPRHQSQPEQRRRRTKRPAQGARIDVEVGLIELPDKHRAGGQQRDQHGVAQFRFNLCEVPPIGQRAARQQQRCGEDQQRIFPNPVERERRDKRGEHPAQRTTGRHCEVKRGQLLRLGAQIVKPGVERGADEEQQDHTAHQGHQTHPAV